MIDPKKFIEYLTEKEIDFYCGVPDSLLKELSFCFDETIDSENHKITANEGSAIALAVGTTWLLEKLHLYICKTQDLVMQLIHYFLCAIQRYIKFQC